ncbi:MAG: hypothetical protein H7343_10180 [Undibacterium sp.]|nr:hypothetical protein [Opitutaceae bacterium]
MSIVFRRGPGLVVSCPPDSSALFRRLDRAAEVGEEIAFFSQDGADLCPESLAALNCYLRHNPRASRMTGHYGFSWTEFCDRLSLRFRRA